MGSPPFKLSRRRRGTNNPSPLDSRSSAPATMFRKVIDRHHIVTRYPRYPHGARQSRQQSKRDRETFFCKPTPNAKKPPNPARRCARRPAHFIARARTYCVARCDCAPGRLERRGGALPSLSGGGGPEALRLSRLPPSSPAPQPLPGPSDTAPRVRGSARRDASRLVTGPQAGRPRRNSRSSRAPDGRRYARNARNAAKRATSARDQPSHHLSPHPPILPANQTD